MTRLNFNHARLSKQILEKGEYDSHVQEGFNSTGPVVNASFASKGYSVMEMEGGFEVWKENELKVEGELVAT